MSRPEFFCPAGLPTWEEMLQVPEDTSLSSFMLHYFHPLQTQHGRGPCLVDGQTGRTFSLAEMRSRTAALAAALQAQYGIGDGDVVMICSPNHIDYPLIVWAVHMLGGIVTLSNPKFTKHELIQQARLTKATLLVIHSSVLDNVSSDIPHIGISGNRIIGFGDRDRLWPRYRSVEDLIGEAEYNKKPMDHFANLGGDRVALLVLSSGTTGAPKAVKLSHRGVIVNILQMATHIAKTGNNAGLAPGDVSLQTLPFFHVAGLILGLHLCLFLRMSVVITEQYDFLRMLEDIVRFGVTTVALVPPQAITLCKHPATKYFALDSVKKIFVGAAPVPRELHRSVAAAVPGAQVIEIYGLTEVSCTLTMTHGNGGQFLPGIEARVVKPDGRLAELGERGELHVKTPSAALGYLDNLKATDETFCDGWIRTGDEVVMTENNEIFVVDRIKDMIKVKGFQVAPAELEGCLLEHSDVVDAAVIGVRNEYSGQVPYAFVVLREAAERRIRDDEFEHVRAAELKASILKHVSERTASYKRIWRIEFVNSIPKTSSGKILRRTLGQSWEKERAKL